MRISVCSMRDDVVAAAQPRVQLAACRHRPHRRAGAAREQHFGEAAGRGADIEADAAGYIETEMIERRRKLDAAARHVGVLGLGRDDRGGGNLLGCFAQRRCRRRSRSPAAIAACARARLSNRPRATNRRSARSRWSWRCHTLSRAQRSTQRCACRPGTVAYVDSLRGPGSASAPRRMHRVRETIAEPQASLTTSPRMFWPSASNALATMPLASRPALAYMAFGES